MEYEEENKKKKSIVGLVIALIVVLIALLYLLFGPTGVYPLFSKKEVEEEVLEIIKINQIENLQKDKPEIEDVTDKEEIEKKLKLIKTPKGYKFLKMQYLKRMETPDNQKVDIVFVFVPENEKITTRGINKETIERKTVKIYYALDLEPKSINTLLSDDLAKAKKSRINKERVSIFEFKKLNMFLAKYSKGNKKFQVEAEYITQEEFINLLKDFV